MKEDIKYNIRFSSGLSNPWDFDLRGAGHLYVLPGKEYFLENCPKSLLDIVVSFVSAMNVSYKLTDNKKGCYQTVNCINFDINDPRSLLSRLRTNRIEESASKEPTVDVVEEVVEEPVIEESVEEVVEESVIEEPVEEVVEESVIEEPVEEVIEDIIEEPAVEEPVAEPVVEESNVTVDEIESMSKPKLEELATSLDIDSVQTKTKKKLKAEIIEKLGL